MRRTLILVASLAALAACDRGADEKGKLDTLDAELVGNATDPAVTAALEDQIMVDPALAGQRGNGSSRATPGGVSMPVPPARRQEQSQASYALANGKLLRTPEAKPADVPARGATLGQLADSQRGARGATGGCADKLSYSAGWATRVTPELAIYPKANVVEAAGADQDPCKMRVVTFRSDAAMQAILDYYYTKALKAGYSAEHQVDGTQHLLGGTRRDDAFMLYLRPLRGGGTEVDLVSNVVA